MGDEAAPATSSSAVADPDGNVPRGPMANNPVGLSIANLLLEAQVNAFLLEHRIDESASSALKAQSEQVQRAVLEHGIPPDSQDPGAVIMSRIQAAGDVINEDALANTSASFSELQAPSTSFSELQATLAAPQALQQPPVVAEVAAKQLSTPEVEEFIVKNGIDDIAAQLLREQEPRVQKEVLKRGSLEDCRSPSAVCLSRIRDARNGWHIAKEIVTTMKKPSMDAAAAAAPAFGAAVAPCAAGAMPCPMPGMPCMNPMMGTGAGMMGMPNMMPSMTPMMGMMNPIAEAMMMNMQALQGGGCAPPPAMPGMSMGAPPLMGGTFDTSSIMKPPTGDLLPKAFAKSGGSGGGGGSWTGGGFEPSRPKWGPSSGGGAGAPY